jgi:hypothetical protein
MGSVPNDVMEGAGWSPACQFPIAEQGQGQAMVIRLIGEFLNQTKRRKGTLGDLGAVDAWTSPWGQSADARGR